MRPLDHQKFAASPVVIWGMWGCTAAFLGLVWQVPGETSWLDAWILRTVTAWRSPTMDAFFRGVTYLGDARVVVGLGAFAAGLLWRRQRLSSAFVVSAVGGGALLNRLLKHWVARPRPTLAMPVDVAHGYSFPSGHSTGSMLLWLSLCWVLWRAESQSPPWRLLLLGVGAALVLMVGWSRIYLGVHYPSDVLAGWALAISWILMLHLGYTEYQRRRAARRSA